MNEKKYTPLLPYDDTKADNFSIYDNVEYVRDMTLVDEDPLKIHYTNMVKYYRVDTSTPARIGGD